MTKRIRVKMGKRWTKRISVKMGKRWTKIISVKMGKRWTIRISVKMGKRKLIKRTKGIMTPEGQSGRQRMTGKTLAEIYRRRQEGRQIKRQKEGKH